MRKFILTAFLLPLLSLTGYAQSKFQVGAYYLPQITSIMNSEETGDIYQNTLTFASDAGVTFTYNHSYQLAFETGLVYSSHNQKFISEFRKGPDNTGVYKGKKRLDYLKLPLITKYKESINQDLTFVSYIGPQFSYLLKGDGAVVVYKRYENRDYYDLPPSSREHYNDFVLEAVGGVGLDIKINEDFILHTGVRSDYSLTDIENKDATFNGEDFYTYDGDPRPASHNFSIGIQMGMSYNIGTSLYPNGNY